MHTAACLNELAFASPKNKAVDWLRHCGPLERAANLGRRTPQYNQLRLLDLYDNIDLIKWNLISETQVSLSRRYVGTLRSEASIAVRTARKNFAKGRDVPNQSRRPKTFPKQGRAIFSFSTLSTNPVDQMS